MSVKQFLVSTVCDYFLVAASSTESWQCASCPDDFRSTVRSLALVLDNFQAMPKSVLQPISSVGL